MEGNSRGARSRAAANRWSPLPRRWPRVGWVALLVALGTAGSPVPGGEPGMADFPDVSPFPRPDVDLPVEPEDLDGDGIGGEPYSDDVPLSRGEIQDLIDNEPRALVNRLVTDLGSGPVAKFYAGDVRWSHRIGKRRFRLWCDRLLLEIYRDDVGGDPDGQLAPGDGSDGSDGPRERRRIRFYFHAEGNVRLEIPRQRTTIEARALYYENYVDGGQLCLLREARWSTTVGGMREVITTARLRDLRGTQPHPRSDRFASTPLVFLARDLRTRDFRRWIGGGIHVTTCDYEDPHFSLSADSARIAPVRGPAEYPDDPPSAEAEVAPGGEPTDAAVDDDGPRDFTIDLEGTHFELIGTELVPVPFYHWDTRWNDYLPIRAVEFGGSSKFGAIAGADWNVNFFLKPLPLHWLGPVEPFIQQSRLDFTTTYFSNRGIGWGPKWEYGQYPSGWTAWPLQLDGWNYYGEGRFFNIRDRGEDRSGIRFPDPDRFWTNVYHRQAVPWLGYVDVEVSKYSDPNFPQEYFESIFKQEKRQESLFAWRRNFTDNLATTGLYKYRLNDFDTVVERTPEGKLFLFQQPLVESGVYTDLTVQAANLRNRPADALGLTETRLGRFDLLNEWSYPVSTLDPYVDLRPFVYLRYSAYEKVVDPSVGSEDRGAFGAGITASQQWSRPFRFGSDSVMSRWFGIEQLKHVVIPKVTYFNLFANDLASSEVIGIDEVDTVDLEESVSLSLRQAFVMRREVVEGKPRNPHWRPGDAKMRPLEYHTRSVLDSEVSFVVYPRPGRDNDGHHLSRIVFDNTVYPDRTVYFRAWMAFDPTDGLRLDKADASMTVEWVPDFLRTTVGDRFTRLPTNPDGNSNFIYILGNLKLDEKWSFQAFWSRDVLQNRDSEYSVSLVRVFHRFAFFLEYSLDVGEDDNHTISANFAPLGMFGRLQRSGYR